MSWPPTGTRAPLPAVHILAGVTQLAFVLVCLLVRQELGPGAAIDELVLLKVIRATIAAVLLVGLGGVLIAQVPLSDTVIIAWLVVPLIGGRSSVRLWSAVIGAEPLTGSPHRLPG
jgi:hypothetical protein